MNFQGTTKIRFLQEARGFPLVKKHDEATCFNCGSHLYAVRTQTDMINRVPVHLKGQWFGRCAAECGYGGFYDIQS